MKRKRKETTARRIKLLDIVTGKETGGKEQMAKHNMPVTNTSREGLTGKGSG